MKNTRVKINIRTGEVEFEGSEEFVQNQMDALDTIIDLVSSNITLSKSIPEMTSETPITKADNDIETIDSADTTIATGDFSVPSSLGEWMHTFNDDINDLEKALITAYFVQNQSDNNEFKTLEVNSSLRDHGIKLSNPSHSLKKLETKKYLFQTRKEGPKIRFMRVSQDGVSHLKTLARKNV